MAHPYESKREVNPGRKAAEARVKAYASGGAAKPPHTNPFDQGEAGQPKPGTGGPKPPGKKRGGSVEGFKVGGKVSTPRADKFARGGHAKGKHHKGTHINIAVVAPHGKPGADAGLPPGGMPPGLPPGGPPMAPPPGMAPPGAGGPPPPGMPPMKRGGVAKFSTGGTAKGQGSENRKYKTVPVGAGGGNFRKEYSHAMKKVYP